MRWSTVNRIKSQLDPAGRVQSDSGGPLAKHADLGLFKHKTTSLKGPYISQKIFFLASFSLFNLSLSLFPSNTRSSLLKDSNGFWNFQNPITIRPTGRRGLPTPVAACGGPSQKNFLDQTKIPRTHPLNLINTNTRLISHESASNTLDLGLKPQLKNPKKPLLHRSKPPSFLVCLSSSLRLTPLEISTLETPSNPKKRKSRRSS